MESARALAACERWSERDWFLTTFYPVDTFKSTRELEEGCPPAADTLSNHGFHTACSCAPSLRSSHRLIVLRGVKKASTLLH
jgi:hypothetical protein